MKIYKLNKNTKSVKYLYSKDKRLAKVIDLVGTITYTPYNDSFTFLIDTILGQMLSNKVADILSERLRKLCDGRVSVKKISKLSINKIKSIGTSTKKAKYIKNLCNVNINFSKFKNQDDQEIINTLTSIKGIGTWSAKMYLIFVLNRQDILPYEDMAFLQSYKWCYKTKDISKESVIKKCKKWSPYSSIAARYLYKALDWGYVKK